MSDQFNIQPGAVFAADYHIVKALSAGGMGAVYIAEQISTGKQRALKVMLAGLVADPALRKRFEQEARIGSLIESEHVVEVVGAGVDAPTGLPWLAMELLHGEELAQVVEKRGALPVQDVLVLFEQLCHAVGAAHRVGVVHRDLKPENIFLAQARRAGAQFMVKVLDFGIAKIVAEASTKQTAAMGSPIWMAPEQADQSPITPGTDVWALGLIAFYLLVGKPYWKSANDENATIPQVLKEVLFEPIVPASMRTAEMGRALPPGFDQWFASCVAREPHLRFPDASQAGAALMAALGGNASMPMSVLGPTGYAASPPSAYRPPSYPGTGPVPGAPVAFAGTGPSGPQQGYGPPPGMPNAGTGPQGQGAPMNAPAAVAGTGGSYTLPAAPATQTSPSPAARSSGSSAGLIVGLGLGGLVLAAAVVAGVWWTGRHGHPKSHSASSSEPNVHSALVAGDGGGDMATVLEAKKMADEGNYDAAHERLAQIAAGSPAQQSAEFKDVEFKWASEALLLADRTPDLAAKRALLEVVAQCATVDETVRTSARDRLAALDSAGVDAGVPRVRVSQTNLRGVGVGVVKPEGVVIVTTQPDTPAPVSTFVAVVPTAPAAAPPTRSLQELANSTTSADWWVARRIIEPKLGAGTATVEEVHILQGICKLQHDRACLKTCARTLSGKH